MDDILAHLRSLIHKSDRTDIRSVQSLARQITGDHIAACMLLRLLYWLPKSRTGWVYKSWRDWQAECGITRAQVKRVHASGLLEAVGVERSIMKAKGAPTVHYRVDLECLFAQIRTALRLSDESIPCDEQLNAQPNAQTAESGQSIEPDTINSLSKNTPIHSAQSDQSITEKDSHTQTPEIQQTNTQRQSVVVDTEIMNTLESLGFSQPDARKLLDQHGETRVRLVIHHATKSQVHNPPGFVRRALHDNWRLPEHHSILASSSRFTTGKYADFVQY